MTLFNRDAMPLDMPLRPVRRRRNRRRHLIGTELTSVTVQLRLTVEELAELDTHSHRRGLRRSGLVAIVVEAALRDKMVSAIVDDGL